MKNLPKDGLSINGIDLRYAMACGMSVRPYATIAGTDTFSPSRWTATAGDSAPAYRRLE